MSDLSPSGRLDDVLVLTVCKSFWNSEECRVFPRRIYARILYGRSQNLLNTLVLFLQGWLSIIRHQPKLILFGSQNVIPWFIALKRLGLLRGIRMIAINQFAFNDRAARHLDRIIVYSRSEIATHDPSIRDRYVFIPLPADGQFNGCASSEPTPYIFAGGGERRDYPSLIQAIRGLDVRLVVVTWARENLGVADPLPQNCDPRWRMPLPDFLNLMAGALFVVVPLQSGQGPHGHTTIVQAQRLGKAVITTLNSSVEDYVTEGKEGLLVPDGNVDAYRLAILHLVENPGLRKTMEQNALLRTPDLIYSTFADRLASLCRDVLRT